MYIRKDEVVERVDKKSRRNEETRGKGALINRWVKASAKKFLGMRPDRGAIHRSTRLMYPAPQLVVTDRISHLRTTKYLVTTL
jgi:hypothetical protein